MCMCACVYVYIKQNYTLKALAELSPAGEVKKKKFTSVFIFFLLLICALNLYYREHVLLL